MARRLGLLLATLLGSSAFRLANEVVDGDEQPHSSEDFGRRLGDPNSCDIGEKSDSGGTAR